MHPMRVEIRAVLMQQEGIRTMLERYTASKKVEAWGNPQQASILTSDATALEEGSEVDPSKSAARRPR